jgi:hypothetical protein
MLVAAMSLSRTKRILTTPAYRAEEPDQKAKNEAQRCTSRAIQLHESANWRSEGGRKQGVLSLYGNWLRRGGKKARFYILHRLLNCYLIMFDHLFFGYV